MDAEKPILSHGQVAAANQVHLDSLTGVLADVLERDDNSFKFADYSDRLQARGVPCIGSGGIDERQDPLRYLLERERHFQGGELTRD